MELNGVTFPLVKEVPPLEEIKKQARPSIKPNAAEFVVVELLKLLQRYEAESRIALPSDLSTDALVSIKNFLLIEGVFYSVEDSNRVLFVRWRS